MEAAPRNATVFFLAKQAAGMHGVCRTFRETVAARERHVGRRAQLNPRRDRVHPHPMPTLN
jgi:hypothetical protein